MWERNIDWLHPLRARTRDQTCNLGVCALTRDGTRRVVFGVGVGDKF